MSYFVYFIQSTNGSTYIGATIDLDKRIRQHNKEIKGGANATSIKVQQGEIWSYICYVENFPDWNEALKFEWRWKQISRQIQKNKPTQKPIERRMEALNILLNLNKPTSKAKLYSEWENPPSVIHIK
jgi:structure-specific endonuclease subunit SLX1